MAGKSGKTTPQTSAPGKGSKTTKPKLAGKVLPVENPMDLWYLCPKASFAEKYPLFDSLGRSLKQRQVSRWIYADCRLNKWIWPYWGEVGFDMKVDSPGQPPEAIMSRTEPHRPSTMPLSRYEILRERATYQMAVDLNMLPPAQIGLVDPLVTTDYLENRLTPAQVRAMYNLVRAEDTGLEWLDSGKPKIPGMLRIPDVIRLHDFTGKIGAARFAASNIACLIEIKFDNDELSPEQRRDYLKIVNGEMDKFRLLETKVCRTNPRRRKWLEKARETEPIFQTVAVGAKLPERLTRLREQIPAAAWLVHDIEMEHQSLKDRFKGRPFYPEITAQLRPWDPAETARREQESRRGGDEVGMILAAPLVLAAMAAVSITAIGAGAALGGAATLVARGSQTLIRFPAGRIVATTAAANAAIYKAAAQPSVSSSRTPGEAMQEDYMSILKMINEGFSVHVLYLPD